MSRRKTTGLRARDIMQRQITTISYAAPLTELERLLGEHKISGLPVTGESGRIIGVVSMRDLLAHYAEDPDHRLPPRRGYYEICPHDDEFFEEDLEGLLLPSDPEERVASIMTNEVYTVSTEATLEQIAREMTAHGIHRVLVEEDRKLVGIISTMEVLRAVAGEIAAPEPRA